MPDILIKGMELSTDDPELIIKITRHRQVAKLYGNPSTHGASFLIVKGAKAMELPAHHGLKDFGDILSIFDKVIHNVDDDTNALLCDLIAQIQAAPTIVEASK